MDNKTDLEAVLQNAVDELFALHGQAKEDHQKFLIESATLIKASHKQFNDAVQIVARAEKAALDSAKFAKQANNASHIFYDGLKFWQRTVFWIAIGLFMVGASLGLLYVTLGKQITYRQYQLDEIQMRYDSLTDTLKDKSKKNVYRNIENN